ncbi:carbohydrate ABC transporter permease [Breznakiella homolactica]|uniref:Sugar ABC transporter permease n=1 Tax=Breznakiella homolactica TaxID=2798577 RepID=A0A7T7XMX5_9SPIR|nr:sugar ABC transporter permease [Breznakiella homolactica]QQO09300.1 sugar ABC transporter permease [Breznakiella homolactica]
MYKKHPGMLFYRKRNWAFFAFTVPLLILYGVLFIAPIAGGLFYSFTDYNGISKNINFVGLKNYISIFSSSRFPKSIWFNIQYSFWLVLFTVVLGLVLALLLDRDIKAKGFFRAMYFFPAVLPNLTMALVFNGIMTKGIPELGILLNIESWEISLLSRTNTAMYAVLFVNIWKGLAIPTVLFLAGLQTVPAELYESASIDGASPWKRFKVITIPFLIPSLTMVFVLTLKQGLMVYDLIMGMTGGGPAGATESMAMLIYRHGFVERKLSAAMAESIILAILVCAISFIQIFWSQKRRVYD